LPNILLSAIFARIFAMTVLGFYCYREFLWRQNVSFEWGELNNLLSYGGWVTISSLTSPLLVIVDRFSIGGILGAVNVAEYTIPYQPAKQIQVLPNALVTTLFPRLSAATLEMRTTYANETTLLIISLISIPVFFGIFLADSALQAWVGVELGRRAAPIGKVLLLGFWVNAFAMVPYTTLQASGRPDLVTKMQLLEIPIYFGILILCLRVWGTTGAAVAFLLRCMMDYVLLSSVCEQRFFALGSASIIGFMLVASVCLTSIWTISQFQWWVAASVLFTGLGLYCWRCLPAEFKLVIVSRFKT
jgi:O-antigen/teichoic acid export membrane protein